MMVISQSFSTFDDVFELPAPSLGALFYRMHQSGDDELLILRCGDDVECWTLALRSGYETDFIIATGGLPSLDGLRLVRTIEFCSEFWIEPDQ